MIESLKPYPAVKDSGVPWLGEVPEHWQVERLKVRVGNIIEPTADLQDGDLCVALENVESWTGQLKKSGPEVTFDSQVKRFCADDVLFGKLRPYLAKVARPTRDGVCVGEFLVLRPKEDNLCSTYLEQIMRTKPIIDTINASTFGAKMPRADWHFVGSMEFPFPPLSEQITIVRLLDHVDRRIRRYIRAKQKQVELLEEQKQAIIQHAVTRGLDSNVRLKPSGMDWLEEVPEHWNVLALRRRWTVIDCKHLTVPFVEEGIPLASVREAQSFELNLASSNRTTPEWYEKLIEGDRTPRIGDLVYCRNVSVGSAALVIKDEVFAMGQDVCLIRSKSENQRWLNYYIKSRAMANQIALLLVGSTFNRINIADIKALLIAVPPRTEQDHIADFLDNKLTMLEAAITGFQKEQALIREYRTRLVADVVTGKLDVRDAAMRLPDEVEELEPLEDEALFENGEEAEDTDFDTALEEAEA